MKRLLTGLSLVIAVALFFSCNNNNSLEKLRQNELAKLKEFIDANYPDVTPKPSGLYYIEEIKGEGDTIQAGDKVQIFYSTWTIDSVLIDESNGYSLGHRFEPYEIIVGNGDAISGLEEAVTYMQKGTKAHLVIPSELAYQQQGANGVPGFTTLLMEVEVYKVYKANTSGN